MLKELKNIGVNVRTQGECDELMQIYEKHKWVWIDGGNPTTFSFWEQNKKETYVEMRNKFHFGNILCANIQNRNYKYITLKEFKNLQNLNNNNNMKIEINKIYEVKEDSRDKCSSFNYKKGDRYIKITNIMEDGSFSYEMLDKDLVKTSRSCEYCFKAEHLMPFKKTLKDLEVGDYVINNNNVSRVLGICGEVIFLSEDIDSEDNNYNLECDSLKEQDITLTFFELEEDGYEVYEPKEKEEIKEMTVSEISKELGYEIKIIK